MCAFIYSLLSFLLVVASSQPPTAANSQICMMHLTWARHLLDNREVVLVEGRHPSSDPNYGQDDAGYNSEEEERDMHHQDMYMNGGATATSGHRRPRTGEGWELKGERSR